MKSFKPYIYVFAVILVGLVVLIAVISKQSGSAVETTPVIKLGYFSGTEEFAKGFYEQASENLSTNSYIWVGVEPEKPLQVRFADQLIQKIEKEAKPFQIILIDAELKIKPEELSFYKRAQVIPLKEIWFKAAEVVKQNQDQRILVLTASIYTVPLLKENVQNKILELTNLKPMTLSMNYFSISAEDEKNNLFPCSTEDKTGVNEWSCMALSKARYQRKRIDAEKLKDPQSSVIGLVDLISAKDYMILIK